MLLLLFLAFAGKCTEGKTSWGPGQGEWETDSPENHGLSSENLTQAGKNLVDSVPERNCFVVIKDGYLIHEDYWGQGFDKDTRFEVDSAGKTVSAALIGAAVTQGLIDVNKPLAEYGVTPKVEWGGYWANITAKHLLSQTSGVGRVPPGQYFTYDSDQYIQHLSYLLTKVSPNSSAFKFATEEFAKPLGIPDLYALDDIEPEMSIGGGQMMTCRQLARVGQLFLNKGKWLNHSGGLYDMVSAEYVKEITSPSFPNVASTYGYLTWLNQEPSSVECCAPRWGNTKGCPNNYHLAGSLIGDDVDDPDFINAPVGVSVALGWLGKYLFTIPDRNMTIVTAGNTWGSSHLCDAREGGYDGSYTLSQCWRAFGNLTIPSDSVASNDKNKARKVPVQKSDSPPPRVPQGTIRKARRRHVHRNAPVDNTVAGSCNCYCAPTQGFGQCYNLATKPAPGARNNCSYNMYLDGGRICPSVSVVRETSKVPSGLCPHMELSREMKCDSTYANTNNESETCSCRVERFERCYYHPSPCDDNPYTPTNGTNPQK